VVCRPAGFGEGASLLGTLPVRGVGATRLLPKKTARHLTMILKEFKHFSHRLQRSVLVWAYEKSLD
jgi:hypothetical protein